MSDETTLPPVPPNNPRTWLRRAWAWIKAHPEYSIPLAAFSVGFVIGKVL